MSYYSFLVPHFLVELFYHNQSCRLSKDLYFDGLMDYILAYTENIMVHFVSMFQIANLY